MEKIKRKYKCNIYDGDDLAQEAFEIALKVIEKYDPAMGPIFNFLSIAVNRRIYNFIRDTNNSELPSVSISNVEEETIKIGNMKTSSDEFWEMLDEHMQVSFRADYLKSRQGIPLSKSKREKLLREIRRIIDECL